MPDDIRIRARHQRGITEVQLLLPHPMETGLRSGADGRALPAHFITDVIVSHGERPVLLARLSVAVSRDPLLSFRFEGGLPGERVSVAWRDNLGDARSAVAAIA